MNTFMLRSVVTVLCAFAFVGCGEKKKEYGKKATPKAPETAAEKKMPADSPVSGAASAPGNGAASGPASAPAVSKPYVLKGNSEKKLYTVTLTPTPNPSPMNTIFSVDVSVVDAKTKKPVEGAKVKVDSTMPTHRHGMMTEPTHKEVGAGVYKTEGMKLHMPGAWVYRVDIESSLGADHALLPYNQPALHK